MIDVLGQGLSLLRTNGTTSAWRAGGEPDNWSSDQRNLSDGTSWKRSPIGFQLADVRAGPILQNAEISSSRNQPSAQLVLEHFHARICRELIAQLDPAGHLVVCLEDVTARMPSLEEIRSLRLAAGTPVFGLVRTAYGPACRAVEVCDTVMSADRFVLTYELPAG